MAPGPVVELLVVPQEPSEVPLPCVCRKKRNGALHLCGKGPTSGEDIFPKWLRKSIGYDHTLKGEIVTQEMDAKTLLSRGTQRPKWFNILRLRRYIACQSCNGGWMERDRRIVQPLVEGTARTLSQDDQKRLARWALKTTMTNEFAGFDNPPVIWADCRRWFYENLEPPPGSYVWIGSTADGGFRKCVLGLGVDAHVPPTEPGMDHARGSWFAKSQLFSLGDLQLVVLISNLSQLKGSVWTDFPPGVDLAVPDGLEQVWPVRNPFDFPLTPKLAQRDAEALAMCAAEFAGRLGVFHGAPAVTGR